MTLADRLAAARVVTGVEELPTPSEGEPLGRRKVAAAQARPIEEIKGTVHAELLEQLRPQLYDAEMDHDELDERCARCSPTCSAPRTPPEPQRPRAGHAGDHRRHPRLRPDRAVPARPTVSEVMVNGAHRIWLERDGRLEPTLACFVDEAHLRRTIDNKIVSRGSPGRRVQPDGRRPPARRQPHQRGRAAAGGRRVRADHPQVRGRPARGGGPVANGTLTDQSRDFLDACVRARPQRVIVSGSTGAARRPRSTSSLVHPGGRAHRHHRGRSRASPPGARGPPRVAAGQHRGSRRGRHPRPGPQRAAHASGPDRRRRGPRRPALDMLQAMNTGHDGSICTVHPTARATRCPASRRWC